MRIGKPPHRNPHGFKDGRCRRDVRPSPAVTGLERHHASPVHELRVARFAGSLFQETINRHVLAKPQLHRRKENNIGRK
jgi:hypothetical protein